MNDINSWQDLEEIETEMAEPSAGPETFGAWGGICPPEKLSEFLKAWAFRPAFAVWETSDSIEWSKKGQAGDPSEHPALSADAAYLERARMFGPDGDLQIRREEDRFLWSFVGEPGAGPPAGWPAESFWENPENEGVRYRRKEETFLLWGEKKDGRDRWHDDRVAAARLDYPVDAESGGRVQARADLFIRNGRTEFVRFKSLEPYSEE